MAKMVHSMIRVLEAARSVDFDGKALELTVMRGAAGPAISATDTAIWR